MNVDLAKFSAWTNKQPLVDRVTLMTSAIAKRYVQYTNHHDTVGFGLVACRTIDENEVIGVYGGTISDEREDQDSDYCFYHAGVYFDAKCRAETCGVHLMNHNGEKANARLKPVAIDGVPFLLAIALSEILPGHYVYISYSSEFWKHRGITPRHLPIAPPDPPRKIRDRPAPKLESKRPAQANTAIHFSFGPRLVVVTDGCPWLSSMPSLSDIRPFAARGGLRIGSKTITIGHSFSTEPQILIGEANDNRYRSITASSFEECLSSNNPVQLVGSIWESMNFIAGSLNRQTGELLMHLGTMINEPATRSHILVSGDFHKIKANMCSLITEKFEKSSYTVPIAAYIDNNYNDFFDYPISIIQNVK